MLTENQVKEQLSIAYVSAVSAACNFTCEFTRIDMDSIDVAIKCNGFPTGNPKDIRSPEIQLQLKATEKLDLNYDKNYPFVLPLKNYDDLRGNTLTPRLLVVLKLPDDRVDWVSHSEKDLSLRNCAFWVNLRGFPTSTNTTNVTVYIPYYNIFSPHALKDLM